MEILFWKTYFYGTEKSATAKPALRARSAQNWMAGSGELQWRAIDRSEGSVSRTKTDNP